MKSTANAMLFTTFNCESIIYRIDIELEKILFKSEQPNAGTQKPCLHELEIFANELIKNRPEYEKLNIQCVTVYAKPDLFYLEFETHVGNFNKKLVANTQSLIYNIIQINRKY